MKYHITPNRQQQEAIQAGFKWYRSRSKQVFEIAGYAGTGKTTLVNWILDACGIKVSDGAFVAYVGKAAMVMAQKGLPARTIHSLIYETIDVPKVDKNGEVIYYDGKIVYTKKFIKRKFLSKDIKIIIVDEGSMVDTKILNDLKSFDIPIIILGDLHQLPPVFGSPACLIHPDVVLTEIMRQQEGNPIIHFATLARTRKFSEFRPGNYGKVYIGYKDDLLYNQRLVLNSNVIICGFNKTREDLNSYIREDIYGFPPNKLCIGDKIICRENDWSRALDENTYLINGMVGYVEDIDLETFNSRQVQIDFRPEFETKRMFRNVIMDRRYLAMSQKDKENYRSALNKFEYGYAITCHLSQGSQYNNVLIVNENFGRSPEMYSKWLYTAITRAVEGLVIAL